MTNIWTFLVIYSSTHLCTYVDIWKPGTETNQTLGKEGVSKTDEFSEKFQKGGGVISNPKIYVADFGP